MATDSDTGRAGALERLRAAKPGESLHSARVAWSLRRGSFLGDFFHSESMVFGRNMFTAEELISWADDWVLLPEQNDTRSDSAAEDAERLMEVAESVLASRAKMSWDPSRSSSHAARATASAAGIASSWDIHTIRTPGVPPRDLGDARVSFTTLTKTFGLTTEQTKELWALTRPPYRMPRIDQT